MMCLEKSNMNKPAFFVLDFNQKWAPGDFTVYLLRNNKFEIQRKEVTNQKTGWKKPKTAHPPPIRSYHTRKSMYYLTLPKKAINAAFITSYIGTYS